MKRLATLSILALSTIFILSNFSSIKNNSGSFIYMMMEDEPILPETPYTYRDDIEFPDHFSGEIDFGMGYGRGEIDSTFRPLINDDVATLGRVLFYDEKLSALENISCASCHKQEKSFADDVQFSEGVASLTKRNSMQLNDLGWTENDRFFWDMSESDIHEMISLPLKDENEIGADMSEVSFKLGSTSYYPDLFQKAFNSTEITEDKIVDALVHFMHSMTTFNSRFDYLSDNDFVGVTDQELHGMELFGAFCSTCHIEGDKGILFGETGEEDDLDLFELFPFIFNNGLPQSEDDLGVGEWNDGEENGWTESGFDYLFKVPTLRNVELTGPYMHDGSIETLEDVVEFYSSETETNEWSFFTFEGGFNFSEDEKSALVAFLKTLTDHEFIADVKFSDPFNITAIPGEDDIAFAKLVIKPNPMGEFSIVEFSGNSDSETQLSIVNNIGQEIINETIIGTSYQLNKANFSTGIYYLNFKRGDDTHVQKLIVQ